MMAKFALSIISICIAFGCSSSKKIQSSKKNPNNFDSTILAQRSLLKDFALCNCIISAYEEDSSINADYSLSFYVDDMLYPTSSIEKVGLVAEEFGKSIKPASYGDYRGKKAVIYLCTNFYKSKKLDSLITSLDSSIME